MGYGMQVIRSMALFIVLCGGGIVAAAQQAPALEHVERTFSVGDAETLLSAASERVEIALFGSSTLYSRAQALYVMQHFFQDYPPVQFSLQHTSAEDGNWFATGRYYHARSDYPLRVYVRLRAQEEEQWEVREIRIEERLRE